MDEQEILRTKLVAQFARGLITASELVTKAFTDYLIMGVFEAIELLQEAEHAATPMRLAIDMERIQKGERI